MAKKTYRNKTKKVQIFKDGNLNSIRVIPGGQVTVDEKDMGKYLRFFEEVEVKKAPAPKQDDKKADTGKKSTKK